MKISNKTNSFVTLGVTALFAFVVAGCGQPAEPATPEGGTAPTTTTEAPVESTPAAFTNEKGEIVCPVMGTVIENKDKAVGYQDHNGKRYYFCCGGCPDQFKDDPAKFEDGKAIN
jgi:YHS domain-containing protein